MNRKDHWDTVYTTKAPDAVSWHQERPDPSRQLIERTGLGNGEAIIDVGGASVLVDHLLEARYTATPMVRYVGQLVRALLTA